MTGIFQIADFVSNSSGATQKNQIGDRFSYLTNVKDFGAKGDGVTDDWAAIMAAFHHNRVSLTATGTNQTASFTGTQAGNLLTVSGVGAGTISTGDLVVGTGVYSYASFVGTISGSGGSGGNFTATLTINSGLVGTVMPGMILFGPGIATNPFTVIISGSGLTWTVQNVQEMHDTGPVQIQAWFIQRIISQQSGTTGKDGVYVLPTTIVGSGASPYPDLTMPTVNAGPEAMVTTGNTITFASVPTGIFGLYLEYLTTPGIVFPPNGSRVSASTSTTITSGDPLWGLVNINDTATVNLTKKGIVYFPRGIYLVSQPIEFSSINLANVIFKGSLGETSVIGNFPDYIFRRGMDNTSGQSGTMAVEGMSITNNNPNGGGVRLGLTEGGYVRDCTVIANRGINTSSDDLVAGVTSQEIEISNCYLNPGTNTSGSIGIMSVSDGPINNCHVVGFDKGIITWGQQGIMVINGGTIELCGYGLQPGISPNGAGQNTVAAMRVSGVLFKNCGTAINCSGTNTGLCRFDGILIDAAEGTISGNPQYGMRLDSLGGCFFAGIRVTGQYAQYGIEIIANGVADNWMFGVQAFNTSSLVRPAWSLPANSATFHFVNCNVPPVFSTAALPTPIIGISSISWASGTTTLVVLDNISQFGNVTVAVEGISPSGYNGTFSNVTHGAFNTVTYSQSNPGAGTGTGSGFAIFNKITSPPENTPPWAAEGDCYNVNNSDASTWGSNPSGTPGSVHAKLRWNGSNWAVIGI